MSGVSLIFVSQSQVKFTPSIIILTQWLDGTIVGHRTRNQEVADVTLVDTCLCINNGQVWLQLYCLGQWHKCEYNLSTVVTQRCINQSDICDLLITSESDALLLCHQATELK